MTVASDGSEEPRLLLERARTFTNRRTRPTARRSRTGTAFTTHTHTIRVVNADGTDVRVLIHATPPFDAVGHIRGIEWSPDGSLIAVDLRSLADNQKGGIYTVRPDGTDRRLLDPRGREPRVVARRFADRVLAVLGGAQPWRHLGRLGRERRWVGPADALAARVRRPLEPRRSCGSGLIQRGQDAVHDGATQGGDMRTFARRVAVVALTAGLVLILALPASAGERIIVYRGETSQAEPVRLRVLKSVTAGARFLLGFTVFFTMTCEDGSTGEFAGFGRPEG